MKKKVILIIAVFAAILMPDTIFAKALNKDVRASGSAKVTVKSSAKYSNSNSSRGAKRTSAKISGGGDLGLGIMMGDVTGLNIKAWNSGGTAFVFGLGWDAGSHNDDNDGELFLQGDYLFHYFVDNTGPGQFGFHYGPGLRFVTSGELGVRFPLGMDFIFPGHVIDAFLEIAPTLNLTDTNNSYISPEVGFRYYF